MPDICSFYTDGGATGSPASLAAEVFEESKCEHMLNPSAPRPTQAVTLLKSPHSRPAKILLSSSGDITPLPLWR